MRRKSAWINLVAILALLIGAGPGSAIASLFDRTCQMACCVGKPAHRQNDATCAKGCDENAEHHAASTQDQPEVTGHSDAVGHHHGDDPSAIAGQSTGSGEGCKCTIRSAPSSPDQAIAASAPTLQTSVDIDGVLPAVDSLEPVVWMTAAPGIVGTDSGPPTTRPQYASLGRAPPVLLA